MSSKLGPAARLPDFLGRFPGIDRTTQPSDPLSAHRISRTSIFETPFEHYHLVHLPPPFAKEARAGSGPGLRKSAGREEATRRSRIRGNRYPKACRGGRKRLSQGCAERSLGWRETSCLYPDLIFDRGRSDFHEFSRYLGNVD